MTRHRLWVSLSIGLIGSWHGQDIRAVQPQPDIGAVVVARGRVTQVHAPRLFTIEDTHADGRDVLVMTPRALSTPLVKTTVEVRGEVRRFAEAELKDTPGWSEIDERTREQLVGRSVLVAASVIATMDDDFSRPAEHAAPAPPPAPVSDHAAAVTLRPATLGQNINELAGRRVRIVNARVVGVLEPQAFLIEPATRYDLALGERDRILVLIDSASLKVPASLIVASTVTILGVARTLLGLQVGAEVPWPSKLSPDLIESLDVRAAVLARSVQTPEGIELTDRQSMSRR
jgi:hypothetical protein